MLDQVAVAAISSAALTAALVHSAVASRNDVETTDVTQLWGQGSGPRRLWRVEGMDLGIKLDLGTFDLGYRDLFFFWIGGKLLQHWKEPIEIVSRIEATEISWVIDYTGHSPQPTLVI